MMKHCFIIDSVFTRLIISTVDSMDTIDQLIKYIEHHVRLTEPDKILVAEAFQLDFVKKRQQIVQPGFTPRHRNFVIKGAFRAYLICKEGQDHTIQFAIEDWWITDYNSYIFQEPATMFVLALEDSQILKITYEDEQRLKRESKNLETFFRIMAENAAAHMQKRIITNLTQTAEKRHQIFIEKYGAIAQRVPQYALASYLGMSTEYLSRLRNRRRKSKKLN